VNLDRSQGYGARGSDHGLTLDDFGRVVKRYWWVILLVVVVATAAAFVFSAAQPVRYKADARLLYVAAFTDSTQLGLEVSGVNVTITNPDVQARAAARFGRPLPKAADYTISAAPVAVTAEGELTAPLTLTRMVAVTAESDNAALAAELANAYAVTFVSYRTEAARANARAEIKAIRAQLAAFEQPQAQTSAGVDYLTSVYVTLTQQLAEFELAAVKGNGGYILQAEAVPPAEPFSPRPVRSAILGFGVGLFVAIILVFLLYRYGARVDGEREVVSLLRLPILGRLSRSRDERAQTGRLVSLAAPTGNAAEAYRRLRAGLSAVLVSDDVKTLLFASARDGEGTSAALANVAVALARTGRRVVVIDADLRSPSLHRHFDLPNDEGVTSIVTGRMSVSTALHPVDVAIDGESVSGPVAAAMEGPLATLNVLTSGPNVLDPGELVAGQAMAEIVAELKGGTDIVLVDSPGLLDAADASALASVVDGLIFIVDTRATSRPALRECREYLDLVPCRQLGVVIMQESRRYSRRGRRRANQVPAVATETSESAATTVSVSPGA